MPVLLYFAEAPNPQPSGPRQRQGYVSTTIQHMTVCQFGSRSLSTRPQTIVELEGARGHTVVDRWRQKIKKSRGSLNALKSPRYSSIST